MDYKNAGVDIEAGYKSVELMKQHIAKTHAPGSAWRNRRFFRCLFHERFQGYGGAYLSIRNRRRRNQAKTGIYHGSSTIPWASTV